MLKCIQLLPTYSFFPKILALAGVIAVAAFASTKLLYFSNEQQSQQNQYADHVENPSQTPLKEGSIRLAAYIGLA